MATSMKTLSSIAFGTVCSVIAFTVTANSAQAGSITSTVSESDFFGSSASPFPLTTTTAPYDFRGQAYESLTSTDNIAVTLTLNDGDTGLGDFDFNNLTLGLDGIDTGIKLNGFRNEETDTLTIAGTPINASAILAALQADGQLVGTVIDANPDGNFVGFPSQFNTTLNITGQTAQTVPEPATNLGVLALGAFGAGSLLLRKKKQIGGTAVFFGECVPKLPPTT